MFEGQIDEIWVSRARKAPMERVTSVELIPGVGIRDDRYADKASLPERKREEVRDITLIEAESLAAVERDYGVRLSAEEARRNFVTSGVPLNHLVGVEFKIGDVRVRGHELCEPCKYLCGLTGKDVLSLLRHRGGLRAQVLDPGTIEAGAAITIL